MKSKKPDWHPVIFDIINEAEKRGFVDRIILFGSRARGDHRPQSDIDLAFVFESSAEREWITFKDWMQHDSKTLLNLDLVDLNQCGEQLRNQILTEGICIYEKTQN